MDKLTYRLANENDAEKLLSVYEQYIPTTVTFEYVTPTVEDFMGRIREFTEIYPYIICERGDKVVGYAYAHKPFTRAAARWSAELTVYLSEDECGERVGEILYTKLMKLLKMQNVHVVYGVVSSPNPRSERFHERMGFKKSGVFKEAGFKNGIWCDTIWYEMFLTEMNKAPDEIIPLCDLPCETVMEIING